MRIKIRINDFDIAGPTGMGPAAWDRDTQKMSMHPPLPGHIEFVEEEMHHQNHEHHVVHRHNPENDHSEVNIGDVPQKYLKRLLKGDVYLKTIPENRQSEPSWITRIRDRRSRTESGPDGKPAEGQPDAELP